MKSLHSSIILLKRLKKVTRGIAVIRKPDNIRPRSALLTIYRSFARPHLDYGDVIYDILCQKRNRSVAKLNQFNIRRAWL